MITIELPSTASDEIKEDASQNNNEIFNNILLREMMIMISLEVSLTQQKASNYFNRNKVILR